MTRERERHHDDEPGPEPDPNGGSSGNLGNLRQRGEDLLSAADEAIGRALSKESLKFNLNVRQASGQ